MTRHVQFDWEIEDQWFRAFLDCCLHRRPYSALYYPAKVFT